MESARQRYIDTRGERSLIDLTNSHFGRAGIVPPETLYQTTFERWRRVPEYRPSGRGGPALREAIALFMNRGGQVVSSDRIVATAGSSVSYHLLFSRLRGTSVALPRPGYPLFEELATGAGVAVQWYHTPPDTGFQPDPGEIQKTLERGAQAVVVISPGNPTGVVIDPAIMDAIGRLCGAYHALLIIDEVFDLFVPGIEPGAPTGSVVTGTPGSALTVRLNGLSKAYAAPDIKLGWIAVTGGSRGAAEQLLHDLDTTHDTFLTVSGFAEAAGPVFLADPTGITALEQIRKAVNHRHRRMDGLLADLPTLEDSRGDSLVGGIHRMLRIDPVTASTRFGTLDDESIAVALIERAGVYVHPGYLYGMEEAFPGSGPWIVVSSLHSPETISLVRDRLHPLFG